MTNGLRQLLLITLLITLVGSASAFAIHLGLLDNEAAQQRREARYTLCREIRVLKISLTALLAEFGVTPDDLRTKAARDALRNLIPPTPRDCVRFADLHQDELQELPR